MRDNPYRSPLAHDEPTPACPSESCFWTIFLMGTSTFVVMLLLTTDLPAGANPQHSNPMWAAKQLLTSPLSLFHWGYRAPSTVSFLLGYLLHAAIWTCLVQGAPLLRSAFRSPAACSGRRALRGTRGASNGSAETAGFRRCLRGRERGRRGRERIGPGGHFVVETGHPARDNRGTH